MKIPAADNPIWTQIATGEKNIRSAKLAINLLIQSNKISLEKDASEDNVKQLAAKTYAFFLQYENVYDYEFAKIFT